MENFRLSSDNEYVDVDITIRITTKDAMERFWLILRSIQLIPQVIWARADDLPNGVVKQFVENGVGENA